MGALKTDQTATSLLRRSSVGADVRRLLGDAALDHIHAPIEAGSGLPNQAYWSEEWFRLEQERIFQRSWAFAGADAEIPKPGDTKPIDIGGVPILLVRGQDGTVRAFQNVCRHRGMRLVAKPCNRKILTCPYHAWAYGLDGKIRTRPHFHGPNQHQVFEGQGSDGLNLIEAGCATFHGCIFVNVSGTAGPLEDRLKPALNELEGYDLSAIRWAGKIEFDVRANWKLAYENYMENYHVFSLHPRLLKFAPMSIRGGGNWRDNTYINGYKFPQMEAGRGEGMPHYPGLSPENAGRGFWFLALPDFAVEIFPDQFTVFVSYPIAPDRTREELHIFLIGDEAAAGERHAEGRREIFKMWKDLNEEDVSILEGMQTGRRCAGYDGGKLSPHWDAATLGFAKRIVEMILED